MSNIRSILLVCTGNSCRSIMAEGLLKKYLKEAGKGDIQVSSAGVFAMDNGFPTKETIEVMKAEGIDVSGFRSRALSKEQLKEADLILVMAGHHMDDIIARMPEASGKVHLLRQYGIKHEDHSCEDLDIEDPIGRDLDFYREVLSVIKNQMQRIASIV